MAAEVDPVARDGVARRRPSEVGGAFEEGDPVPVARGAERGADTGRAAAQHQQVGVGGLRRIQAQVAATAAGTGCPAGQATAGGPVKPTSTRSPGASAGAPITRERSTAPSSRRTR